MRPLTVARANPPAGKKAYYPTAHRGPRCRDRQQRHRARSFAAPDRSEHVSQLPERCPANCDVLRKASVPLPAPDGHGGNGQELAQLPAIDQAVARKICWIIKKFIPHPIILARVGSGAVVHSRRECTTDHIATLCGRFWGDRDPRAALTCSKVVP